MANRIHANTAWLDQCAGTLQSVGASVSDAQRVLAGIHLRRDEGGQLKLSMSCGLKLTGTSYSGSTTQEDIAQLAKAAAALSGRIAKLSSGASKAARAFEEAEEKALRLINAADVGKIADIYEIAGGEGGTLIGLAGIAEAIRRWIEQITQWIDAQRQQQGGVNPVQGRSIFDEGNVAAKKYGGDQGSPYYDMTNYGQFREIIQNNTGKNLNDKALKNYLKKLNSEGCGYVAIANAIFLHYAGRESDFERDYGFPMYQDGKPNYNPLVVDIYSSTDNYREKNTWEKIFGTKDGNYIYREEDESEIKGSGVNQTTWEDRALKYLEEHGIDAHVKNFRATEITVDNYNAYAQRYDNIRIDTTEFTLYTSPDKSGEPSYYDGGHAMTITGVENGMFVVSSWGKKYYVDPKESNVRYFQAIVFD